MGLGLVILVCLHIFLQYGLTNAMRDIVLPRIKEETGIDARVGRLSINVPGGILSLKEVAIRNPEGYLLENLASVDRIQVEFDILSLLKKKPILVKNIEVKNALLNIVRNKDGDFNLQGLPGARPTEAPPVAEPSEPPAVEPGGPLPAAQPAEAKPWPEILIHGLSCNATVRYLDFRLEQYDIALDLQVSGHDLSTQQDPATPWGHLAVIGSLGDDRTSFITDLKIRLAPISNPKKPSFDLAGRIMEIDPRILEEAYDKLGIRSAPFSLEPTLYCRNSIFTNSMVALDIRNIQLEDKLADDLGGMASIDALRFAVPITGTLQEPSTDIVSALAGALGGNTRSLLDAFLKGAAAKEAGLDQPPETMTDAAVEVLGAHVEEIGESETVQQVLKDLIDGEPAATNQAGPINSDILVEILGEHVEEVGENEVVKDELKSLGKWLFNK